MLKLWDNQHLLSFVKKLSVAAMAAVICFSMSAGVMPLDYVLADEVTETATEEDTNESSKEETKPSVKKEEKEAETKPEKTAEETAPEEKAPEETVEEPGTTAETSSEEPSETVPETTQETPSETETEAPEEMPSETVPETTEEPSEPSSEEPSETPAEKETATDPELNQDPAGNAGEPAAEIKYTLSGKGYLPKYKSTTAQFKDGELVIGRKGTRLEAFSISIRNQTGYEGSLTYRAYIRKKGWSKWADAGKVVGTKKKNLRIEAVQIKLTGELAKHYFVEYKASVSSLSDAQGWVHDGTVAGTMYNTKRIEELRVRLVPIGENLTSSVIYRPRITSSGWQTTWNKDGEASGTFSKRIEAITISLGPSKYPGGITYRTYIQDGKWTGWTSAGAMSGNSKKGKRIECIQMKLTGEMAEHYDIYYRTYTQSFGWHGWAENGQASGSTGCFCGIDKIQIVLREKGAGEPGNQEGITSTKEHAYYAASNAGAIMTYKNILSCGYTDPDIFRKQLIKNFEYMDGVGYFHMGKMVQGYTDCAGSVSLAFRVALGTAKFTKKYKKGTLSNGKQLYGIGINYCGIKSYKDKFGWCRNGTASVNSHFLNTIIKNRKIKYSQVSLSDRSNGVHGWSNEEWIDYLKETGAKPGDVFVWFNHDWNKTKGQHMTMYAGIGEDGIAYEWTASSTYGVILSPLTDRSPQNIFESFTLFKGVADINGYY